MSRECLRSERTHLRPPFCCMDMQVSSRRQLVVAMLTACNMRTRASKLAEAGQDMDRGHTGLGYKSARNPRGL